MNRNPRSGPVLDAQHLNKADLGQEKGSRRLVTRFESGIICQRRFFPKLVLGRGTGLPEAVYRAQYIAGGGNGEL